MHEKSLALDERRRRKRFRMNESSFVIIPDWPSLGKVVNMSQGGFAFEYVAGNKWSDELSCEGMLFGANDSCLNNLPFSIIQDFKLPAGQSDSRKLRRRCCAQFGELTPQQQFMVECFMWVNCTAEC